jgi:Cu/Zn superoxide dismutase
MFNRIIKFSATASCATAFWYVSQNGQTDTPSTSSFASNPQDSASTRNAICLLYPTTESQTFGIVSFQQDSISEPTKIVASIKNLNPNSVHGLLIHHKGDLTEGIKSVGEPYNPYSVDQQKNTADFYRFTGDLGNLKTNEKGEGYTAITHPYIKLFGETNIFGRSCVVYSGENSSQTGLNSSQQLAAGIIGHTDTFKSFPPSA